MREWKKGEVREKDRERKRVESKWWVLWTLRYNDTLSSDTYTFYSHSDCVDEGVKEREGEKDRERK